MKRRFIVVANVFLAAAAFLSLPVAAEAGTYLQTAFVPELATPTLEIDYTYRTDQIKKFDLITSVVQARLSYVLFPGLEASIDGRLLSYSLEYYYYPYYDPYFKRDGDYSKTGMGLGFGLKYLIPPLLDEIDLAAGLQGSYSQAGKITEYDITILALASSDVSKGLTPFAGFGMSYNQQKFELERDDYWSNQLFTVLVSAKETKFEPVFFVGVKYMIENHLGIAVEAMIQDGLGGEASFSYRF